MSESVPVVGDSRLRPRAVIEGVPAQSERRRELLEFIRRYVRRRNLVPPLSLGELDEHCTNVLAESGGEAAWRGYAAVLLNNEVWRDTLGAVPFNRRLLLLPRCLRMAEECPSTIDQWGLLCRDCGRCVIGKLKTEAQRLGYVVLVAEGAAVVVSLVESGKIEAVIGVSCLASLERIFPCIEAAAIPGIAIPLLQDGCRDTQVDFDWVWEALGATSPVRPERPGMEDMRMEVETWFTPHSLESILGAPANQTERIAQDWLALSGKRWRPFLAVCGYMSLRDVPGPMPPGLRKIALAVECFHKASLIHDDIEDNDPLRYGRKTLHEEYGTPIALNVGDFLLGEGYRMIGQADCEPARKEQMLRTAADGHRSLCIGQGQELLWMRQPGPLSVAQVLDIFRRKTAPAFEVALRLGAIYAGAGPETWAALAKFSDSLGIAYQIRDDIDDLAEGDGSGDAKAMRPSVLLAIGYDRSRGAAREVLRQAWGRRISDDSQLRHLRTVLAELEVAPAARTMLGQYKQQALDSLRALDGSDLKVLLRRVVGKIFHEHVAEVLPS